jgi:hypothetical protein
MRGKSIVFYLCNLLSVPGGRCPLFGGLVRFRPSGIIHYLLLTPMSEAILVAIIGAVAVVLAAIVAAIAAIVVAVIGGLFLILASPQGMELLTCLLRLLKS